MDVDMHEELASQSQGFTQEDDQLLLSLGGNASALQGQIKEVFCALSERKMGPEELSSISQRAVQLYRDAVFETPWRCYICEQHDLVSKGYANTVVRGMGGSNLDKHLHDHLRSPKPPVDVTDRDTLSKIQQFRDTMKQGPLAAPLVYQGILLPRIESLSIIYAQAMQHVRDYLHKLQYQVGKAMGSYLTSKLAMQIVRSLPKHEQRDPQRFQRKVHQMIDDGMDYAFEEDMFGAFVHFFPNLDHHVEDLFVRFTDPKEQLAEHKKIPGHYKMVMIAAAMLDVCKHPESSELKSDGLKLKEVVRQAKVIENAKSELSDSEVHEFRKEKTSGNLELIAEALHKVRPGVPVRSLAVIADLFKREAEDPNDAKDGSGGSGNGRKDRQQDKASNENEVDTEMGGVSSVLKDILFSKTAGKGG